MGGDESTWVAPGAGAFGLGLVTLVISLVAGVPAWIQWIGVAIGSLLILYFVVRYAAAAGRGEVPHDDHDEPPGGWSTQGPYTSS